MAGLKVVIGDKTGKCVQKEVSEENTSQFHNLKIGDRFKGELLDLPGYEFEITGGSDSAGFPMRSDVPGTTRKQILTVKGVGVTNKIKYRSKKKKGLKPIKGMRQRKTVAGNTVHDSTAQINVKVVKAGSGPLFEEKKEAAPEGKEGGAPQEGVAPAESKPEEKPAEEPKSEGKEEPKEELKAEEKPAETPTEEKKE
jgi:small subunit ribosomal protein S6e